jgi:hypothetical protein
MRSPLPTYSFAARSAASSSGDVASAKSMAPMTSEAEPSSKPAGPRSRSRAICCHQESGVASSPCSGCGVAESTLCSTLWSLLLLLLSSLCSARQRAARRGRDGVVGAAWRRRACGAAAARAQRAAGGGARCGGACGVQRAARVQDRQRSILQQRAQRAAGVRACDRLRVQQGGRRAGAGGGGAQRTHPFAPPSTCVQFLRSKQRASLLTHSLAPPPS